MLRLWNRFLGVVARHRMVASLFLVADVSAVLMLGFSGGGSAQGLPPLPALPTNDLQNLLSLTGYPTPARVPTQESSQPALAPVPAATCGAGSRPLTGEQGRVTAADVASPAAARGWTCNLGVVGHYSTPGGFRVWRYVDAQGHACAYYDTSLFSPANIASLAAGPSPGVVVLDMSDPAHPVQTAMLTSLPMLLPHESLNLNARRGLLGAELGNGGSAPGLMSIYDVSRDCRHPALDATYQAARFGHESGFSPDGRTFWIGGGEGIAAVDVSDPTHPHTIWEGNEFAHGLNLSDDGDTLYDSDPIDGDETILDVSQIQNRVAHPVVKEISRLTWDTVSIPQNTDPMTIGGRPYLLEFDEFAFRFNPPTVADKVGAARIIAISDPAHPRVVSNLRLQVNMRDAHRAADGDPSGVPAPVTDYAAHYCQIPREVDPEIVACSFINSGLRIFNISDPAHPREVGYFVSPPKAGTIAGANASDLAFSQPAFDPARREVWYTDANSGFYVVRLDPSAWPDPVAPPSSAPGSGRAPCAAPSGRLAGRALGPLALGQRRAALRRRWPAFSVRRRRTIDDFCFAGDAIRAGYPSPRLLRSLGRVQRRRLSGRAVLLLTANAHYSLGTVRAGQRLVAARYALKLGRGYRIGRDTWYLSPGRVANRLLEVRGGAIQEIGLVNRSLTATRPLARRLLASFD